MSKVFIDINLVALGHNFRHIQDITHHRPIWAMIKANAYSHGIIQVAKTLSEAAAFGVASLEEGLLLREHGIKQPIILMQGVYHAQDLHRAIAAHLSLVIHDFEQIKLLQSFKLHAGIKLWLKIDTGMNRLGFAVESAGLAYNRLRSLIQEPSGIMTHLAQADDIASPVTATQLALFSSVTQSMLGPKSIANSAGILAWPTSHADWVRPGLILYGVAPFAHEIGMKYNLAPVMTLSSQLVAIKAVKKGEYIGYGGSWQAPNNMFLGIAAIGYADGYPQIVPYGTPVLINGIYYSIVGRVSMDMLAIDLTDNLLAQVGDKVIFWGPDLPIELVAQKCKISPYDLLCRVATSNRAKITFSG